VGIAILEQADISRAILQAVGPEAAAASAEDASPQAVTQSSQPKAKGEPGRIYKGREIGVRNNKWVVDDIEFLTLGKAKRHIDKL